MADDIIARLRCSYADPPCEQCAFCAARAEIERLRAAGDALAATWPEEDRCGCDNKDCRAVVKAFDAWQEARRG